MVDRPSGSSEPPDGSSILERLRAAAAERIATDPEHAPAVEPTDPEPVRAEPAGVVEPIELIEPTEPVEPPRPVEPTEPVEPPRPVEPTKPVEPPRPVESKPGTKSKDRQGLSAFLREFPVLILIAFGLAILLKTFFVQAFFIPSGSMEPTLEPGDRVLVRKVLFEPDRGDIIVFADPEGRPGPDRGVVGGVLHWLSEGLGFERPDHEDFIKRVIGLPGESVEIRNGRLYVDGLRIKEPYLSSFADTRDYGPQRVPQGKLFVLGDNRLNSNDSRFGLGFVPVDKVIGRAFVIVWPPSRAGWLRS